MLFYFYIISIVFSVVSMYMMMLSFFAKLKHDKIKIVDNLSLLEEIEMGMGIFFKVCLPFFNILYIIYLFFFHSYVYQNIVTKLFLHGNAVFENM